MEIRTAKTAGFCYGVQRAVDMVEAAIAEGNRKIYTYGPIVHNDLVVGRLRQQGVEVIEDYETLCRMARQGQLRDAVVVIRAHGVGNEVYELLSAPETGALVADATCPYVRKIHKIVREHYEKGERLLITGSGKHPEVVGILGQIGGDALVIETPEEAEKLDFDKNCRICLVSQTTFSAQKFEDVVAILKKKQYNMDIINTICNATQMRQKEAAELAGECDVMLVIGGRNSSNTAKLYDICRAVCEKTYFIQSAEDLDIDWNSVRCVGITAGASTPKTIIEEVLDYVRHEFWRFREDAR